MKAVVNGVNLGYDDHGIGLPVIFLHAFPLNRGMWEGVTTALLQAQRFRLVSLDLRGFGESEIDSDILTMEQFADDVVGLMDALGMQQAVLCGLSMGGYTSFAFLRKHAARLAGLILADTKPQADSEEAKVNRENLARLAESQGTSAVADLQISKLLGEYTRQHRPEVEAHVRRLIDANPASAVAAASRGMALRADSSDLLASIACPTLVIVGEQDTLTPPSLASEYAALIPDVQFSVIPQAGHLSNLEQPEAFLSVVENFLHSVA